MRKTVLALFLWMILIHNTPLKAQNALDPVSAEPKRIPMGSYINLVPDPKAREITGQIDQKLSVIKSASCEIAKTNITERGNLEDRLSFCFQKPDLYFSKSTNVKHPLLFLQNSTTYLVMDGKFLWQYIQNAPGSGKTVFQGKNIPQEKAEAFIKQHETPKILRYDISRLRQAGNNEIEFIMATDLFINPFYLCDPLSLKLEREDETTWWFLGKSAWKQLDPNLESVRLFIGKEDGVLQKQEFMDKDGKTFYTEEVSNVKINPEFPPNQFIFNPPQGIEVKDMTEAVLNPLKNQSGGQTPKQNGK
jgi:outer membrane lipoprotein-sorting protein